MILFSNRIMPFSFYTEKYRDKIWKCRFLNINLLRIKNNLELITIKNIRIMTKTITFNELRRIKDSLPDGSIHRIADELNVTDQTVRNYFGGSNYQFGKNCGLHIEPGPDGGIVVLDNTTIYDMAVHILEEENKKVE